jgi:hypothetical protein
MKFTINTKEFKSVMQLVKTVADNSANARITAHNVCLLRAFPSEKQLKLEFSLNGSFLTYIFEDVTFEFTKDEGDGEIKRSVDLGSLSSLRFSGASVDITLGKSREGNTLEFNSGRLKGKLILSHADIEKEIESARPQADSVELNQTFSTTDFLSALSAHNYGFHHNAQEAAKRPVRIYNQKNETSEVGNILFVSKDKIAAASFMKPMTTPFKDTFDYYVLPKPLQAVLSALSQDVSPVFHFGIAKDYWRVHHGQIDVWFPNIIPLVHFELEDLKNLVNTSSCFSISAPVDKLKSALSEIEPFTSDAHLFSKDDMPIIQLIIEKDKGYFSLNTSKAKDVVIEIEDAEFIVNGLGYDPSDTLNLNFKYLSECVTALEGKAKKEKKKKEKKEKKESSEEVKGRDPVVLMWWPYLDVSAPTKGKALCLKCEGNYYWISRVREQARTL